MERGILEWLNRGDIGSYEKRWYLKDKIECLVLGNKRRKSRNNEGVV